MKKKKREKKDSKELYILVGILLFVFGVIIGTAINYGRIANLEGFLFNRSYAFSTDSNASDSNATSSNASCSNATASNASCANATASDASCSNATSANLNYNDLYLSNVHIFGCGSNKQNDNDGSAKGCYVELKEGDPISLGLEVTGDSTFVKALVYFQGNNGDRFSLEYYPGGNTQNHPFIVPTDLIDDTYDITGVLLTGRNYDTSTFTKLYGDSGLVYKFNKDGDHGFKLIKTTTKKAAVKLKSISLNSDRANNGDKVSVNYKASENLKLLKLTFSNKESAFSVNVNISNEDSYFTIPSNVEPGEYSLTGAILKSDSSSNTYTNNKKSSATYYNFNIKLTVEEKNNEESYVYNNEDIDSKIISKIYKASSNSEIYINANSSTLLVGDLFNAIKGTSKKLIVNVNDNQLVFNGNDITTGKTIDAKIEILEAKKDEEINSLTDSGYIIKFTSNGDLPGKATVRIKSTDELKRALNDGGYVYYYNEVDNKFLLISDSLKLTDDGYYEFTITHHSKYLLTKNKMHDDLISSNPIVANNADEKVSFQRGTKTNLLLICCGALVCIIAILIVLIIKPKDSKTKK